MDLVSSQKVRSATGSAIDGVAPLAHPRRLKTLVDDSLERYPVLWAAAGAPGAVFPTSLGELLDMTGGRLASITKEHRCE